jgi:hypothetical protein
MALKNVLMIGGPADGQRFTLAARQRTFCFLEESTPGRKGGESHYAIGGLRGLLNDIPIGVRDLNVDAILALLTAYRRPGADDSDAEEAARLVTVLGGPGDGMRIMAEPEVETLIVPLRRATDGDVPEYRIVPLVGKDQRTYRVAILDPMKDCPITMLINGYRQPLVEATELEECKFCGAHVETPCEAPPPDICEKAINATYGRRSGEAQ